MVKHKLFTIIIVVNGFLMPLLIIQLLFKIPGTWITSAEWTAGDMIQYCIGFFTLLGTLILGGVATRQSERANDIAQLSEKASEYANKINDRMVEFETFEKIRSSMPTIYLDHVKHDLSDFYDLNLDLAQSCLRYDGSISGNCYRMSFSIVNNTNEVISFSQPYLMISHDENKFVYDTGEFSYNENFILRPGESNYMHFLTSKKRVDLLHDFKFRLSINLDNRFGEAYRQNINGVIISNKITEDYIKLFNVYSDFERYNYLINNWVPLDFHKSLSYQKEKGSD